MSLCRAFRQVAGTWSWTQTQAPGGFQSRWSEPLGLRAPNEGGRRAPLPARACALLGWGLRGCSSRSSDVVAPLPSGQVVSPGPRSSPGLPGWRTRAAVRPWKRPAEAWILTPAVTDSQVRDPPPSHPRASPAPSPHSSVPCASRRCPHPDEGTRGSARGGSGGRSCPHVRRDRRRRAVTPPASAL